MNLGARGALEIMNSMGGLPSITKNITAGDRVAYIFPVEGVDENGKPIITVSYRRGHNVDLGDDYKRSFIPTKSKLNSAGDVVEPDLAFSLAPIFRALFDSDKARKIADIERTAPNETAKKIELETLEKRYKNEYPALSSIRLRVYSEVAMVKLDANNQIIGEVKPFYGSLQISKKKLNMLISEMEKPGAYEQGANYAYIVMQTTAGADKKQMTQVDWTAITDADKRIEVKNPTFAKAVTDLFNEKRPTAETIGNKIYDFKEYDEAELKKAVAEYVADREYMLKDINGNFNDVVLHNRNVEALRKLNLVATADQIEALINGNNNTGAPAQTAENKADLFNQQFANQTADSGEAPFENVPGEQQQQATQQQATQQQASQQQQQQVPGQVHGTAQI